MSGYRRGDDDEIKGRFFELIRNMYSKLKFRVKTSEGLTESMPFNIGVRQGDVLSPILFNLYINDVNEQLNSPSCDLVSLNEAFIECLMYCDDIVLLSTTQKGLQNQLDILESYCDRWHLNFNSSKTKIMVISIKKLNVKFLYKNTE